MICMVCRIWELGKQGLAGLSPLALQMRYLVATFSGMSELVAGILFNTWYFLTTWSSAYNIDYAWVLLVKVHGCERDFQIQQVVLNTI